MPLASARASTPMQVGAIVGIGGRPDVDELVDALRVRIAGIGRLRQRLVDTPFGCGRPIWVDDAGFRFEDHVRVESISAPLGLDDPAADAGRRGPTADGVRHGHGSPAEELLALAATTVTTPLALDSPLWRAVVAVGDDGSTALIMAFHHVLADGVGGLAVLARLVDGLTAPPTAAWPEPAPPTAAVAADAWMSRWRAVTAAPSTLRRLLTATRLLRPASRVRAAPCSLNRPTGPRRSLAVVRTRLEPVHAAAHGSGVTVNDAVLVAVAGALRRVLLDRGEDVDRFVISVPVAARSGADADELGNQVGVVPIEVPATGPVAQRLSLVHDRTDGARSGERGASAALVGPAFRMLGRVGLLGPLMDHQRMVHAFTTNLRGPDDRLEVVGHPVSALIGVALAVGNVTVSFTVVSYAGDLAITVVADADRWGDLDGLRSALGDELRDICSLG